MYDSQEIKQIKKEEIKQIKKEAQKLEEITQWLYDEEQAKKELQEIEKIEKELNLIF